MKQKTKQKLFTFLYVALIVGLIAFMIFMVFWLKGEGKSCMADPIKWLEEKNEGAVCNCYKDGVAWPYTNTNQYQNNNLILNP